MRSVLAFLAGVVLTSAWLWIHPHSDSPPEAVPQLPTIHDVAKDKNTFYYIKDRRGLCYAVLTSKTYAGLLVRSITNIPCEGTLQDFVEVR